MHRKIAEEVEKQNCRSRALMRFEGPIGVDIGETTSDGITIYQTFDRNHRWLLLLPSTLSASHDVHDESAIPPYETRLSSNPRRTSLPSSWLSTANTAPSTTATQIPHTAMQESYDLRAVHESDERVIRRRKSDTPECRSCFEQAGGRSSSSTTSITRSSRR